MGTLRLPKYTISFTSTDRASQELLFTIVKSMDLPIYSGTYGYDRQYPYFFWTGSQISQTRGPLEKEFKCESVEEFLKHFFQGPVRVSLNEQYEALVEKDAVKVGCQTIPFEKVKEVYDAMVDLRKE